MRVNQVCPLTVDSAVGQNGVYTISTSDLIGSKSAAATGVPAEHTEDVEKADSVDRTVAGKDVTHPTS